MLATFDVTNEVHKVIVYDLICKEASKTDDGSFEVIFRLRNYVQVSYE